MSIITSTNSKSAPRPARSVASASSMESAWATLAPPCIASLVASESWPTRAPTIKSLISVLLGCLDDFSHRHAETVLDKDYLATGNTPVDDVDFHGLTDLAV